MGPVWARAVVCAAVLAALAAGEPHEHDSGFRVGHDIDENGSAVVTSSEELHAALTPQVLGLIERVSVVNFVYLDPLALVPTLRLDRDLSVCGSEAGVEVAAQGPVPLADISANATLTLCNFTLDLVFPMDGSVGALGAALVGLGPGGTVRYRDVKFRVTRETYAGLTRNVGKAGAQDALHGGAVEGLDLVAVGPSGGAVELENVTIVAEPAPKYRPAFEATVSNASQLVELTRAASRGDAPVDIVLDGNFTLSACMLEAFNGGEPINVLRPLTLRAGPAGAWLTVAADVAEKGFFKIYQNQVRLVGVTVAPEAGAGNGDANNGAQASSRAFAFDDRAPGCRVVQVDTLDVKSCDAVADIARLALHGGGKDLVEGRAVGTNAVVMERYTARGECFQNATFTCAGGPGAAASQTVACRGT